MCKIIVSYNEGLTIIGPKEKKRDMNNTYNAYLYFQNGRANYGILGGKTTQSNSEPIAKQHPSYHDVNYSLFGER